MFSVDEQSGLEGDYGMSTIGFIGLGLIGGSIAKGIRRAHPDWRIMAYDVAPVNLEAAQADGTVNEVLTRLDDRLSACDFIFLCMPVNFMPDYLDVLTPFLGENCILTDVGSTKTAIHQEIGARGLEHCFIGGHPMAGSEKSGYAAATDHLLENAYYVLTPTAQTTADQFLRLAQLVEDIGALPLKMDCETHDYTVAGVSHLPHIIASALVNLVKHSDNDQQYMKLVAAGGFKDITRIASSSPVMWEHICLANQDNVAELLKDYIASLEHTLADIQNGNGQAIHHLFAESGEYRNSISERGSGPLQKEYSLYCDIVDRAGAIATIATLLSIHQISIKNIGIIHNREYEEGVLKIEFYKEESCVTATEVLQTNHYTVYPRK